MKKSVLYSLWGLVIAVGALIFFTSTKLQAQNPNPSVLLDDSIQNMMFNQYIPGASTLIVKNDKIVWMESYGDADIKNGRPVSDTTAFLMASVSKLFTGTAAMQLHERGWIDLDDDINHYLKFPIEVPYYEYDSITFRDLMTHTASIADEPTDKYYSLGDPNLSLDAFIRAYLDTAGRDYDIFNFYDHAPGDTFAYSNVGTALLGYLVEEVSGMPFEQYCRQNIFGPLCMDRSSWFLSHFDTNTVARPYFFDTASARLQPYAHYGFADYPSGQLRTSISDLANFMLAYLNRGMLNGDTLLRSNSVNAMLQAQVPGLQPNQGLNWYVDTVTLGDGSKVPVWGHNGGEKGVSTDMYLNRRDKLGVAVITNGDGAVNTNIINALYDHGLGLSASSGVTPNCPQSSGMGLSERSVGAQVYPNPSSGEVYLQSPQGVASITLHNSAGVQVKPSNLRYFRDGRVALQLEEKGFYILNIETLSGAWLQKKVLIR